MTSTVLAAASTSPNGPDVAIFLVVSIVGIVVYWVPTFVASRRHARNMGAIVVINLLLGWTFIGWVVALAMALADPRPAPAPPPSR